MRITKRDAAIAASVTAAFAACQPAMAEAKQIDQSTRPITNDHSYNHELLKHTPNLNYGLSKEIGTLTKAAPREAINNMIQLAAASKRKIKVTAGPGWAEYHEGSKKYPLK